MKKSSIFISLALLAIMGNGLVLADQTQLNQCKKLQNIVDGHQNDFKEIRGKMTSNKLFDSWVAKYQLIGKDCQILGWQDNKYSYSCKLITSGKASAMEQYQKAKSIIESCLDESWALQERQRHGKDGSVAIYSSKNSETTIATQAFDTSGFFDDDWTNYLFVGDPKHMSK